MLLVDLDKSAAQRGFLSGQLVYLLVELGKDSVFAGTATLRNAGILGETSLRYSIHDKHLSSSEACKQVLIGAPKFLQQCKAISYPYSVVTNDAVTETLGSIYTTGFYA